MSDWIEDIPSACKGHRPFIEWLVDNIKPRVVVELGVDYGYTTFVFAQALAQVNTVYKYMLDKAEVYGIDWFEGDEACGYRNTQQTVEQAIKERDLKHINIIKGSFDEIAKSWVKPIGVLFIDGSHDYESVKRDLETWSKFVRPDNGVILMHDIDVGGFGVRKVFDEITGYLKLELNHSYGLGILTRDYALHNTLKPIVSLINKLKS